MFPTLFVFYPFSGFRPHGGFRNPLRFGIRCKVTPLYENDQTIVNIIPLTVNIYNKILLFRSLVHMLSGVFGKLYKDGL